MCFLLALYHLKFLLYCFENLGMFYDQEILMMPLRRYSSYGENETSFFLPSLTDLVFLQYLFVTDFLYYLFLLVFFLSHFMLVVF